MKLSKKAYYGLRAALALSKADKPLSIHVLAQKEGIPEDYLEKILQTLRRSSVVTAKRGITGGYQIASQDISAWDVVTALEGPLKVYPAFNSTSKNSELGPRRAEDVLPCYKATHCQTNSVFRSLEESFESTLKKISLQTLSQK